MIALNRSIARAAAIAGVFLGAALLASPVFAATSHKQMASSRSEMSATSPESGGSASVEARIRDLHKRLKITDAQKDKWDAVAQVMRENAQKMTELEKHRAADAKSMTAVDVVKSYSEVIDAHEDGMKKFIPAFEDLYNSMSDSQKKIADSLFRSRARAEARKVVSKSS